MADGSGSFHPDSSTVSDGYTVPAYLCFPIQRRHIGARTINTWATDFKYAGEKRGQTILCNFISYGGNIVAATTEEVSGIAAEYIGRYAFYHCFETPNLHWLDERLAGRGYKVCFMAEYFLPDVVRMPDVSCPYEARVLEQADFAGLYLPQWGNALCEDRKQLDVLGVGAYDGGKLVGLAGCSADCETMWQIGVDVLPEYRRRGVASALTSRLAREILRRGKVPFYCSAWSNIRSAGNAIRSGFIPAWVEMTVKPARLIDEMNQTEAEKIAVAEADQAAKEAKW